MENLRDTVKESLTNGGYNISAVVRATEVSRHWIKKIINGDNVPSYILLALDNFLHKGTKND
jgi:hypothetical protein